MDFYTKINEIKKEKKLSFEDIGKPINKGKDTIRMALKRKSLSSLEMEKMEEHFFLKENSNEKDLSYNEGKVIKENELFKKKVYVIPIKGRAGLENAYYDRMKLEELETEELETKQEASDRSTYFKVEVEGISMDDSTRDSQGSKYSLAEGDYAYCRSIPKMYWRSKLHAHKWAVFCFFHNTRGIIFKIIKEHNPETGEIVLKSLNPDKNKFPDIHTSVSECSFICNIVKVETNFNF